MSKRKLNVLLVNGCQVSATVIESMGYNHDIGGRVSEVEFEGRTFKAVNMSGFWREWGPRDRARPLVEHLERCAKNGESAR